MRIRLFLTILISLLILTACGPAASTPTAAPAAPSSADATANTVAETAKLNLNTATGEEFLAAIPGLGNRMVREFEEYRPYVSIAQFRKEIGKYVDAVQVAEYEKYVYVPVDPNASDEETLLQLPGLDAAGSAQLIAARPYASSEDFIKKLAELAPGADLDTAQGYLATQ